MVNDQELYVESLFFHLAVRLFYASTHISIMASLACLIFAMFSSEWASHVSLGGKAGSMTRALKAARKQSGLINKLFIGSVIGFVAQVNRLWVHLVISRARQTQCRGSAPPAC